jgi:hypothetical protein
MSGSGSEGWRIIALPPGTTSDSSHAATSLQHNMAHSSRAVTHLLLKVLRYLECHVCC